jgi:hypothetical protein
MLQGGRSTLVRMAKREFNNAYKVVAFFGLVDSMYGSQYNAMLEEFLIPVRQGMKPDNPYMMFLPMCSYLREYGQDSNIKLCQLELEHLNDVHDERTRDGYSLYFN